MILDQNKKVFEVQRLQLKMTHEKNKKLKVIDKTNCSEMLSKTSKQIKVMNQILDRLIP